MPITSIINYEKDNKQINFPCLMVNKTNKNLIVFFINISTVVSVGPENKNRMNDYWNINDFEKFEVTVTLKNS